MSTNIYNDIASSADSTRTKHHSARVSVVCENGARNPRDLPELAKLEDDDAALSTIEEQKPNQKFRLIHKQFLDKDDEKVYKDHVKQQKIQLLDSLIVFSISFSVFVIITRSLAVLSNNNAAIAIQATVVLLDLFLLLVANVKYTSLRITSNATFAAWTLFAGQTFCELILKMDELMPDEKVLWVSLLIYLTFIVLPVRLHVALLLAIGVAVADVVIVSVALTRKADNRTVLVNQVSLRLTVLINQVS